MPITTLQPLSGAFRAGVEGTENAPVWVFSNPPGAALADFPA